MAALPTTAPAKPAKPHKVLIFSRIPSAGYQHSSIPLAAKTVEELGKKTGAWTSDTSWDPGGLHRREPEAVRRDLPLEHDRLLPRQGRRQGGDRCAPGGVRRVRPQWQGRRGHSRDGRFLSLALPERRRRRRRGGGGGRGGNANGAGRHAGLGDPALVVGPQREEAPGQRPDADEGRHGSRQRRLVHAARSGEHRQGRAGRVHERHRAGRDAGEPVRRHGRAATAAAAAGRTGTT